MSAIDDGGPAYPCDEIGSDGQKTGYSLTGASLRDVIAMHAMQGMLSAPIEMQASYIETAESEGKEVGEVIALCALEYADCLIAARKVTP